MRSTDLDRLSRTEHGPYATRRTAKPDRNSGERKRTAPGGDAIPLGALTGDIAN
jgi:hypothetical protein